MADRDGPRLLSLESRGASWLQRALFTVLGAAVIVLAFFFLTIALVAGASLAIVIAVRFWWVLRRVRAAQHASAPLEGEYTVVKRPGLDERGRQL